MVLRTLVLCCLLLGCKQSLFDSHGGDDDGKTDGGNGSNQLPATCPQPCLGDGGGDFDGTAMGSGGHWNYVEDHKDRTWTPMTASGSKLVGAVSGNEVTSCAKTSAPACSQLPGALLVSTAGGATVTAVEWIAPTARVAQIQLGVRLPDGAPTQTVRLYRGSREDALFAATADPGVTVQKTITLDVLQGERIYVTMDGDAVTQAAVQLFFVGDMATFPATCQVAVEWAAASGNTVDNLCGDDYTFTNFDTSNNVAPTLGAGPYAELGMAGTFAVPNYYSAPNPLPRTGDVTIQMWAKFNGPIDDFTGGWPFSDLDLDLTGGLGIVLFTDNSISHLAIEVSSCTDAGNPLVFDQIDAQYPDDKGWHFIRVSSTAGNVSLCVDGAKIGGKQFTKPLGSSYAPYLGKNNRWLPTEPAFNGEIDDLRVISQALPCN